MSKVGIFGGSFNPIHKGHTELARTAFKMLKLNEMLIIPTAQSPHKQTAEVSFEHRAEMCRLAFENDKGFVISDIEKQLGGTSYTINTVRALKEIYPKKTEFYLIIGGDMLFYFENWFRHEALLKECHVVAAARENDSYVDMLEYANELGRVKVLNLPVVEISSTELREKLAKGEDCGDMLDEKVMAYIAERGIYCD